MLLSKFLLQNFFNSLKWAIINLNTQYFVIFQVHNQRNWSKYFLEYNFYLVPSSGGFCQLRETRWSIVTVLRKWSKTKHSCFRRWSMFGKRCSGKCRVGKITSASFFGRFVLTSFDSKSNKCFGPNVFLFWAIFSWFGQVFQTSFSLNGTFFEVINRPFATS